MSRQASFFALEVAHKVVVKAECTAAATVHKVNQPHSTEDCDSGIDVDICKLRRPSVEADEDFAYQYEL